MADAEVNFFEQPWYVYIILTVIGAGVGFVGGFAGIGGAPFMVALLKLFVQFCQHRAQGTVLAVMLPPMALLGVLAMKDRAKVMFRYSTVGFVTYAVLSYVGALAAFAFDSKALGVMFGVFLILLSVYYAVQYVHTMHASKRKRKPTLHDDDDLNDIGLALPRPDDHEEFDPNKAPVMSDEQPMGTSTPGRGAASATSLEAGTAATATAPASPDSASAMKPGENDMNPNGPTIKPGARLQFNMLHMAGVGMLVGTIGGMFGIGAGVLMVPIFTELYGLHKNDARVLSLSILLPPVSAGAVIKYQQQGAIDWWMALFLFLLYFFSNPAGAKVGRDMSTVKFKFLMGVLLGVLGGTIILFAFISNPLDPTAEERCASL